MLDASSDVIASLFCKEARGYTDIAAIIGKRISISIGLALSVLAVIVIALVPTVSVPTPYVIA